MKSNLSNHNWWNYINEDLQELLNQSQLLIELFEGGKNDGSNFHDYSFVVFPAAKAYEGFLKTFFLDLGLISELDYYGNRFRIGKALNPSLEKEFRKESVYDKLSDYCGGTKLPARLWNTWKRSRNILFHWFPQEANAIDFAEAKKRVELIFSSMDYAFEECKINRT